jgi:dipeptidyl aminopeptidase/acylaminoacyl peptidase
VITRFACPRLRSLFLAPAAVCFLWLALASVSARAQATPLSTVDDDCTAMSFAPDGRLVYAVRHMIRNRLYDLQRDDIWLLGKDGKRRRLINGEKLLPVTVSLSYSVNGFRWSPGGHLIAVELNTIAVLDRDGNTRESPMTLLLDDEGKHIRVGSGDALLENASDAAWLADEVTVVYLSEAVKPNLLFSINSARPVAGRGAALFDGRTFVGAAWDPRRNLGYGVERDRLFQGPPRLQRLGLAKETADELATLDGYVGGITVSPSGTKVAYYLDQEVLEIRDLAAPTHVARIRIGFGAYAWSPDERRILLKRAPEKKSGDLVSFDIPALNAPASGAAGASPAVLEPPAVPLLRDFLVRNFQVAPDGRTFAIINPGKHNILIYTMQ